ncbi:hypothetical protein K470DRAFT_93031 [Piedraia hortae CBS 480.64]|uniref:Uncharacterized protein n=1 Tax=Piedraia hortae CBS 480.64 TaxID=1314780 RepID=A0A6A7BXF1_9PEZI|nr:hypothetical protein K470DRAFT_93031 [Piedraia hortae CBS 480.64]
MFCHRTVDKHLLLENPPLSSLIYGKREHPVRIDLIPQSARQAKFLSTTTTTTTGQHHIRKKETTEMYMPLVKGSYPLLPSTSSTVSAKQQPFNNHPKTLPNNTTSLKHPHTSRRHHKRDKMSSRQHKTKQSSSSSSASNTSSASTGTGHKYLRPHELCAIELWNNEILSSKSGAGEKSRDDVVKEYVEAKMAFLAGRAQEGGGR